MNGLQKTNQTHNDVNGNIEYQKQKFLFSSEGLLKFRLCYYAINSLITILVTLSLFQIDFESFGDERLVKGPKYYRFRYYTIWNYELHLFYFPLAIYCDWSELTRRHNVDILNKLAVVRNFLGVGLMTITTLYVDSFFWPVWLYDRELIVPSYCDVIISGLIQQCLHTITLITVFVDLLTVPRVRPSKFTLNIYHLSIVLMMSYYIYLLTLTKFEVGHWIYPILEDLNLFQYILFSMSMYATNMLFFYLQWKFIDVYWGKKLLNKAN